VTICVGLADRGERSIEIADESARGRGVGTRLIFGALDHLATGEVVFASVAPGNTRSIRCFLGAGFMLVGAESILTKIQA
jgi:RimJ/RimL family protein N-acetyltransferase